MGSDAICVFRSITLTETNQQSCRIDQLTGFCVEHVLLIAFFKVSPNPIQFFHLGPQEDFLL